MSLERLCRVGNDFANLKEVILTAVRLCKEVEDWAQLNTTLTLLSKRRGQHSRTVTAMVQEVRRGWKCETCSSCQGHGGLLEPRVTQRVEEDQRFKRQPKKRLDPRLLQL